MSSKTLFLTGGSGEIGAAIKQVFTENGFIVIAPTSKELDCGNNESINGYFSDFNDTPIHSFVHCAGINNPKSFLDVTEETVNRSLQINTLSFLFIAQKLFNNLKHNNARLVAVSSIYGTISRNKRIEYAVSKHGLKGIVQTLALEMAKEGILVNSVSPGFIATKLTYKNNSQETIDALIQDVPLKQLGKPEYIAELIYFLSSEKNQFITGQDIIIDGGYLIGGFQN